MNKAEQQEMLLEQTAHRLDRQPTTPRRCLRCDHWMRSTGPDHRICNTCFDPYHPRRGLPGTRII